MIAVGQPDIVFIHGQGEKQRIERLYKGFKAGNTHFVANHFIVAPDGWIYADTGSGPAVESVTHPEVKAQLSSGMFRFKPDGSAIEQVSSKGGNGFGAEVTSDGALMIDFPFRSVSAARARGIVAVRAKKEHPRASTLPRTEVSESECLNRQNRPIPLQSKRFEPLFSFSLFSLQNKKDPTTEKHLAKKQPTLVKSLFAASDK